MSDLPELNLEGLPAWARASLEAAFEETTQTPPSALAHRDTAAWPLLLEAAVVSSFLPRELAPDAAKGAERAGAEKVILGFAEMAYCPEGVKWSLTQRTRTEVLEAAKLTGELFTAIDRAAERFVDPVSRALRECLKGGSAIGTSPVESQHLKSLEAAASDLKSLEAIRAAVALLSGVSFSKASLPQLEELDRRIEFRRLMAQFERMVVQRPEEAPSGRRRYFFGRTQEMESLRGYVGIIGADSVAASVRRAFKWVSRSIGGRGVMTVWGIGGAGKTALISQFMLEHAQAAASDTRFPFAYLDFDRATISARQRAGLLAEMCLQTGTQFEELSRPLNDLRASVSGLALKLEASHESDSMSSLASHALEFRRIVEEHLASLESRFGWERPFLLVFDTFEVVQYAQDDVVALEEFVHAFSRPDETGIWSRMRLIISGRHKVLNFLGEVEELALGALDPEGSVELLMALARDAGKPIERAEASKLVTAVAKATKESNKGVQPLRLQLIGEVFKDADGDGPSIARELTYEMQKPLKSGGLAAQALIDGVLVRRVLGHVRDPRVRALTDPGLVVRRITADVIKNVMTRGTSHPSADEPEDADAEPTAPWRVDEAEAQSIFEAFKREVSLVAPDGDALRHRLDLRQQMLPLIRALRPKRFEALHRLAFDYYQERAVSGDNTDAAEAIYHGLWLNEPLSSLNKLWRRSIAFDPRISPEEFDRGSSAHIFVRAKARAALTPNEVSTLPPEVALDWLDARSTDLLNYRRIEGAIQAIRTAAGNDFEALEDRPGTAAVLARLMYRAGLWGDAAQLAFRYVKHASDRELSGLNEKEDREQQSTSSSRRAALLSLFRTWATIVAKGYGSPMEIVRISRAAPLVRDPLARIDIAAHGIIASMRMGSVLRDERERLKGVIQDSMRLVRASLWKREPRILRLAILAGGYWVSGPIMEIWVESRERVPRDVDLSLLSELLSRIFRRSNTGAEFRDLIERLHSREQAEAWNRLDELWRREKETVLEELRGRDELRPMFWQLVAFEHSDWKRPLGNSLTRALKQEGGEALAALLDEGDFQTGKGALKRRRDGVAVAQEAADNGRLLSLARALSHPKDSFLNREAVNNRPTEYPQDAFGISRALLQWHTTITETLGPESSPPLAT